MSTQAVAFPMAEERKSVPFQIKCEEPWLERVKRAAHRLGISAAAYMRMATTRMLEDDEATERKPPKPKK